MPDSSFYPPTLKDPCPLSYLSINFIGVKVSIYCQAMDHCPILKGSKASQFSTLLLPPPLPPPLPNRRIQCQLHISQAISFKQQPPRRGGLVNAFVKSKHIIAYYLVTEAYGYSHIVAPVQCPFSNVLELFSWKVAHRHCIEQSTLKMGTACLPKSQIQYTHHDHTIH